MKKRFVASLLASGMFFAAGAFAQSPTGADRFVGTWEGTLQVSAVKLRIAFVVEKAAGGGLQGNMISIDQGNAKLPAVFSASGDTLIGSIAAANVQYKGVITAKGDSLHGTFTQGAPLPLDMKRVADIKTVNHPQDPKPPFPYQTRDVTFESAPGVRLAGTVSIPQGTGPFPTVVFVTGSGPQDRDEALMGHRPFAVIADYLARRGIASLRYDDRGVAKSTGKFTAATSADFANDAEAAIRFLKSDAQFAGSKIGIIGHSEGGLIAPMVAARNKDVAFIVMMAGPGIGGDSILYLQQRMIAAAEGASPEAIEFNSRMNHVAFGIARGPGDSAAKVARLDSAIRVMAEPLPDRAKAQVLSKETMAGLGQAFSPWFGFFLTYDPQTSLSKVTVPVLAMNGTLDLQVPYQQNLPAIEAGLKRAGNKDYEIVPMPGLNHLFQTAKTGGPSEYAASEETVNPAALERIATFINKRFGRK
jgi:pimeloyl-ACP methyl ester carboxylesterase